MTRRCCIARPSRPTRAIRAPGIGLALMGKYDLALAALERARELGGEVPSILGALGEVLARMGRIEEARACLHKLTEMSQIRWVPASCFAVLHVGLGDYPAALTFLESATDRR